MSHSSETQNRTAVSADQSVLRVCHLSIDYETASGTIQAVSDISFELKRSEILGIVGESGCGKSTAAMGILRLTTPPGKRTAGQVWMNDTDIMQLDDEPLRQRRWAELALIPQGAMNSLNPTMSVHAQIRDVLKTHKPQSSRASNNSRIFELLELVGLPRHCHRQYPHELSGGMKQRVCIAMAVALNPAIIIADEATSALDVVVQRLVAQTLLDVKKRLSVSMIMIGHDLGLMAQTTDRIMVMYAGKVVEIGNTGDIIHTPSHPYTQLLLESLPRLDSTSPPRKSDGMMHDPRNPPLGCIFQLRCPYVTQRCREESPHHDHGEEGVTAHRVYCHYPLKSRK